MSKGVKYNYQTDYIINLDDVWKWLGFSTKQKAKDLLEKHFIVEKDYKILRKSTETTHIISEKKQILQVQTYCLTNRLIKILEVGTIKK